MKALEIKWTFTVCNKVKQIIFERFLIVKCLFALQGYNFSKNDMTKTNLSNESPGGELVPQVGGVWALWAVCNCGIFNLDMKYLSNLVPSYHL